MIRASIHQLAIALCVVIGVTSCSSDNEQPQAQDRAVIQGDTLRLTSKQQARTRLEFSKAQYQTVHRGLAAYGMVHVPPEFDYTVNAPLGGSVISTKVLPGERVRKGQILVTLQHQDFITLQQDFLTTASQLSTAESELRRQQTLARDSINARKMLERAQAEVASLRIQRKALAEKLALIHINANTLTESNLSRVASVPSPISGYVTNVTINNGMYVSPNSPMIELADTDHMHIELSVFEKDVQGIVADQPVRVWLTDDPTRERIGHVHLVGREVRQDKTVAIHAHLNSPDPSLIPGTTLRAVIETAPHQGWVVPESAVVRYNGKFYVFTGTASKLVRREVGVSAPQQGLAEILSTHDWLPQENILTVGAAAALGAMVNTED
ncbi:MAG: efflux RND transporter periplasmic adaptor subunit [Ignavibacteria bacterium]|jgi:cobalt-zinc-cadmium efflux system membrane fusion protein